MSEELGRIEKPEVDQFKKGRKLIFIPFIVSGQEVPQEYQEKSSRYWLQAVKHLSDLEIKLGKASRVYHELISSNGDDGLKILEHLNRDSFGLVKDVVKKGASLEALEDAELLAEVMDCNRCITMGLQSRKVVQSIFDIYNDSNKQRNEHMAGIIDKSLKENEIGVVIMREGHQVQFPTDIEVFYVAPPALDEINRWLRDRQQEMSAAANQSDEPENDAGTDNAA